MTPRTCGWCGASTAVVERTHCASCGGALPSLPRAAFAGALRAEDPGPPPRELPAGYPLRVTLTSNVFTILGVVFSVLSIPLAGVFFAVATTDGGLAWGALGGLGFGAIGLPMLVVGLRRARRKLDALRHGVAVDGMVLSVQINTSTRINGQHPWRIDYAFDGPGGQGQGHAESWSPLTGQLEPGEPLWVVVVPDAPERNAIWPPMR